MHILCSHLNHDTDNNNVLAFFLGSLMRGLVGLEHMRKDESFFILLYEIPQEEAKKRTEDGRKRDRIGYDAWIQLGDRGLPCLTWRRTLQTRLRRATYLLYASSHVTNQTSDLTYMIQQQDNTNIFGKKKSIS